MSRRHSAEKRQIDPDPLYGSLVLAKFINKVMECGKKSVARRIVYNAIEKFSQRVKAEKPLEAFEQALENAKPALEVKSRRIGGATYQVPIEIPPNRRASMAMRWIITPFPRQSRPFNGRGFSNRVGRLLQQSRDNDQEKR